MKTTIKLIALLTALMMIALLAACGGSGETKDPVDSPDNTGSAGSTETADNTETAETEQAGEPASFTDGQAFKNDFDMAVMIDGKAYPVRVYSTEVLSVLGTDCEKDETISCVYDGMDKTFTYDGIIVSTVPVDGKDVIEMFTITSSEYTTTRNITVGATRDEVIKAYGENYWDDGYVTYTESGDENDISEMRIQFAFEGDAVSEIYIYSPSYAN